MNGYMQLALNFSAGCKLGSLPSVKEHLDGIVCAEGHS